jgi:hypothetical protein
MAYRTTFFQAVGLSEYLFSDRRLRKLSDNRIQDKKQLALSDYGILDKKSVAQNCSLHNKEEENRQLDSSIKIKHIL